jgi:hypothetical protein
MPVRYLTASEPAPFVLNRLERAGDWCFEQGSGWSKIPERHLFIVKNGEFSPMPRDANEGYAPPNPEKAPFVDPCPAI